VGEDFGAEREARVGERRSIPDLSLVFSIQARHAGDARDLETLLSPASLQMQRARSLDPCN
jgi:hypothetical protein